jgi:hypothetical protein
MRGVGLVFYKSCGRLSNMSANEAITQLRSAVSAMEIVDVEALPEATLGEQIDQLATVLYLIDAQLSRVAESVRARGFQIEDHLISEAA